jgi:hypothetical protein
MLWDPDKRKTIFSSNVTFQEHLSFWNTKSIPVHQEQESSWITATDPEPSSSTPVPQEPPAEEQQPDLRPDDSDGSESSDDSDPDSPPRPAPQLPPPQRSSARLRGDSSGLQRLSYQHRVRPLVELQGVDVAPAEGVQSEALPDDSPLTTLPPEEIASPAATPPLTSFQQLNKTLCALAAEIVKGVSGDKAKEIPTPKTWQEALSGEESGEWLLAMQKELEGIKATGTYVEVPRATAKNVIKSKWVFRVKRTAQGAPLFKGRLVAKGYSQKEGVDFFDTWAPTAKQVTARCLLHLGASRGLEIHAMDVDQAFLQGDLEETVYMEPPPQAPGGEGGDTVWLLKKPLYGLKQAPRQWHAKLKGVLIAMGLKCSDHDPSLFIGFSSSNTWILVYVDDLLIMAEDTTTLQELKNQLKQKFPLKDLGPISNYLGMEITRDREKKEISLQQVKYIEAVQKRFADYPLSFYSTPLETNHGLTAASAEGEMVAGQERYPELVGSLMYLMVCTRPDLAHPLSVLGRFVGPGRHGSKHWKAALRVLGYVVRTKDLKLTLGGKSETLEGFTDASWADHQDDRKSSQGYCFTLGSGVVSWRATRSPAVALSSCEAELYGGTSAAQELLWIKRLLYELKCYTNKPVLWCDNKSTVAQTRDPVWSARSKHIEARYFFIRELTQGGEMRTEHIAGEENPADIFTKALTRERHYKLLELLGLQSTIGSRVPPSRGCVEDRSSNSVIICN